MIVGITASRFGMSRSQTDELAEMLMKLKPTEFHHGMCVGGDHEAHLIAQHRDIPVVGHPPIETKYMIDYSFTPLVYKYVFPALPYLDRNKAIVHCVDFLFVGARGEESLRSGTWSTKRYAQKVGCKFYIL